MSYPTTPPHPPSVSTSTAGSSEKRRWRRGRSSSLSATTAWSDVFDEEFQSRFLDPTRRRGVLTVGALVIAVGMGFAFSSDPYYLRRLTLVFIALIIACGLNILVGHAGQVSLGHAALYATGGYAAAWITTEAGVPAIFGLVVGMAVGALAGVIVGAPALRVRGAYLALVTMAFGLIVYKVTDSLRQVAPDLATVYPPTVTGSRLPLGPDQQLYFLGLILAAAVLWVTRSFTWSYLGRSTMAVAGSEDGASSVGISVYKTKLTAFVFASTTAGLAGAMYNYVDQLINPSTYDPVISVRFLFVLVIGGLGTAISGPFLGAGIIFLLQLLAERLEQAENLALATVLLAVVWFLPKGIAGSLAETRLLRLLPRPYETYTVLSRSPRKMPLLEGPEPPSHDGERVEATVAPRNHPVAPASLVSTGPAYPASSPVPLATASLPTDAPHRSAEPSQWSTQAVMSAAFGSPAQGAAVSRNTPSTRPLGPLAQPGGFVLIVERICKRYGGVVAVEDVSLRVPQGSIHAIMGPNGSGKTTCLDIIAGRTRPDSGRVILNGADVTSYPAHKRYEAGLARTFQNIQLFPELPVIWNIAAAVRPSTGVLAQLLHTRSSIEDEIRIHGTALEILEEWGLTYLTFRKAGVCSYGQQKMIELARAAASKPSVLLVDEPSTGLNPRWIELMVAALSKLNAAGTTLLIIEHHQAVISDLAQEVTVLDEGRVIARGTFDQVREDPVVQRVYLGESYRQAKADQRQSQNHPLEMP